jgi:hypothetical protein
MTDYRNNASQREKLDTLFADQRQRNAQRNKDATTFAQFGESEANEIEGRHAKPATVVGSTPIPHPPPCWGSPCPPQWVDPVPQEPPLGVDVHAHEPVGEFFEVEKSLGGAATEASSSNMDVAAQSDEASPSPTATPSQSSHSADASGQGEPAARIPQSGSPPKSKRRLR